MNEHKGRLFTPQVFNPELEDAVTRNTMTIDYFDGHCGVLA